MDEVINNPAYELGYEHSQIIVEFFQKPIVRTGIKLGFYLAAGYTFTCLVRAAADPYMAKPVV